MDPNLFHIDLEPTRFLPRNWRRVVAILVGFAPPNARVASLTGCESFWNSPFQNRVGFASTALASGAVGRTRGTRAQFLNKLFKIQ